MAMSNLRWWIAVSVFLVATFVMVFALPAQMLSPGAVLKGHETLAKDCFACHTPLLGSRSQKCVACHQVDQIGLVTTQGVPLVATKGDFHQELSEQTCTACHGEHQGAGLDGAMKAFSHDLLPRQLSTQCGSCHTTPEDSLHRNLDGNCQQCHGTEAWTPAILDHATFFELDMDHDATCATCHVDNTFNQYTCYGCHEHTVRGIRAEHVEEGIRDFDDCVDCHRSADEPDEHHDTD
jgi:hypothetical protein